MRFLLPIAVTLGACGDNSAIRTDVLVFSHTTGFRHSDAIDAGSAILPAVLAQQGITTELSEDPAVLLNVAAFRAVVFLYTTGTVTTVETRAAIEDFVGRGGGWVGLHSAADTEYEWPFYQQLVVSQFASHPAVQAALVDIEDRDHPATAELPDDWLATDEWYNFATNPRGDGVRVLATVDESSYEGGTMGADHPIAWSHERLGGRAFYSGLGHDPARWREPEFVAHVVGGVTWALGAD